MKRSRLRRPSPALVLAFIALTIAMAGSAVAASGVLVTSSKQIKAHSIALSDLSKSTVKKLRGKRGLRGLTGATGAQGAAGATGATGPSDVYTTSNSGFVTMTDTGLATQVTLRTLNLPVGKFLINAYVLLNNRRDAPDVELPARRRRRHVQLRLRRRQPARTVRTTARSSPCG